MITKLGFGIVRKSGGKMANRLLGPVAFLTASGGVGAALKGAMDTDDMDDKEQQAIIKDKNLSGVGELVKTRAIRGLIGGTLGALPGAYLAARGLAGMHLGKMIAGAIGGHYGAKWGEGIANAHYGRARADYLLDPDKDE